MSEQLKQDAEKKLEIARLETETDVESKTIGQDETELTESKLEDESGNESSAEAEKTENTKSIKQKAKEKLEAEKALKTTKVNGCMVDESITSATIDYLMKRCEDDQGLAEDVIQDNKTWYKCLEYIIDQVKKKSGGASTAVKYCVVYEWAEDYYHKEEKPEAKKKVSDKKQVDTVNKAKPAVKKVETQKNSSEKTDEELPKKDIPQPEKKEKPKKKETPQKQDKPAMDGQMSLFDLL